MPAGTVENAAKAEREQRGRRARLLVVLLAFAWGFNWIAAAIALHEVPPWSLRFAGAGIGAATCSRRPRSPATT